MQQTFAQLFEEEFLIQGPEKIGRKIRGEGGKKQKKKKKKKKKSREEKKKEERRKEKEEEEVLTSLTKALFSIFLSLTFPRSCFLPLMFSMKKGRWMIRKEEKKEKKRRRREEKRRREEEEEET